MTRPRSRRLEIAGLGVFGQKCAPVAPCRVAGDAPQAGMWDAEDVFHARHQGRDEVEIGGLGHFEQLFAQGHNGGCLCRESPRSGQEHRARVATNIIIFTYKRSFCLYL